MKKVLSMVLVWVMVLTLIPLGAVTASAETLSGTTGDCTWTLVDGVLTISGNGAMADYREDTWGSRPWYSYESEIVTVIIESGVTKIGDYAFYKSYNIETFNIANTVKTIGENAFGHCRGLYYLVLPTGVEIIEKEAFECCVNLTAIEIPYTLKAVRSGAFVSCVRLIDVYYTGNHVDKQNIVDEGNFLYCGKWHHVSYETLIKTEQDKWCYYVGGIKRDHTTLVKYKDKWFYVENGIWNENANTLVAYKGKGFYVEKGKWNKKTTLVKYNGGYSYVKGGIWTKVTTLVKYKNKWFYVENGVWKKDTLIFKYNGKKFYIADGKVQFTYTGKVKVDGMYYNVKKGKVV